MEKKIEMYLLKAREIAKKYNQNRSKKDHSYETGKIVLVIGTSTAGKSSICNAVNEIADKEKFPLVIEGIDTAQSSAWDNPSGEYESANIHYINALKSYAKNNNDSLITTIEHAAQAFDVRTLMMAFLSRRCLGIPKWIKSI